MTTPQPPQDSKMQSGKLGRPLNIGVVGATGMVGKSFMETLEQRNFPVSILRPFASEASVGKTVALQGRSYTVEALKPGCFDGLDLVFFSSGDDISRDWAPQAAAAGAWAIDNSAAFRMNSEIALIVPEVNGNLLGQMTKPQVIANPNCSTIQLVVALKPLLDQFGLIEVRVSSYQAVSGAGQPGFDDLWASTKTHFDRSATGTANYFPHPIAFNCIPQIGSFDDQGYCSEEVKIIKETRKILGTSTLRVSAFTVRVPVINSHAEAVWVTLEKEVSREQVLKALQSFSGLVVQDNPQKSEYPMQIHASGQDPVFVGRVHRDLEDPYTWLMWIVADNVRKGAALNGMQIAERIFDIT
jgi:aspartate-semialdehyde dehydrogenase